MEFTTTLTREIDGKEHVFKIKLESYPDITKYWFVSIETDFKLNLCDPSYGFFKSTLERNTRLRALKSIKADALGILGRITQAVKDLDLIIDREIEVNISGKDFYYSNSDVMRFNAASNIFSKQSNKVISWYDHDVFKQGLLKVHAKRDEDGHLRLYADETQLYDLDKLKALRDSDRFTAKQFAFFNYNEVLRLLGEVNTSTDEMSGLFARGIK